MAVPDVFDARAASPSPAERASYGKRARGRAPRSSHGAFTAGAGTAGPRGRAGTAVRGPAVRAGAGPLRADAGVTVPLLPGRRRDHGGRPRAAPGHRADRAAVRGRTSAELPAAGLPERHLVFDINDFDETHTGPFEWDVKRLAASFAIAGRANGFTVAEQSDAVRACVAAYRLRMREFAGMRALDIWYAQDDADRLRELAASSLTAEGRMAYGRGGPQGARPHPPPGVREAHPGHAGGAAHRGGPAADHPAAGPAGRRVGRGEGAAGGAGRLRAVAGVGPAAAAEPLPAGRRGPEGGGRRQCRHPLLDRAAARPGRRRSAAAPGQGGPGVGARPVHGRRGARQPGPHGWWRASG